MSAQPETRSGGIGFLGLLAIVFITLKLVGVIAWPWWVVLSPLWGGAALVLVVLLVAFAAMMLVERRDRR